MTFLRQLALLATTACMGLVLTACESRVATAPTQAALKSTVVTPATLSLGIRGTQALSVMGQFSDGTTSDFTGGSTYASSNASVATVNSAGLVTGVGAGTAMITTTYLYSYGGATQTATGTAAVTVTGAPLVSIAISPVASMPIGTTQALVVTGTYADATTGAITTGLGYVSSDPTVATVSGAGVVTSLKAGTTTITVTEATSHKTATATITVVALSYTVLDFSSAAYGNTPFGGAAAVVKTTGIPTGGATGSVLQFTKTAGAACYAGDTMWVGALDSIGRLPFSATATTITMQVYVPVAGVVIKLKAEDANNPGVSVETDVTPTTTGWQTLSFDFSHQSPGTAALVIANTYNKLSVFADFTCVNGNPPPVADEVFYIGPIKFIGATAPSAPPLVPVTVSYAVVDYSSASYGNTPFGGAVALVKSTGIPAGGPAGPVLQFTKTAGAACYAGDTMWLGSLDSVGRLPFSATATTITIQAYVPVAGVVIKLKVEDAGNPGVSVETDVTPSATGWQALTFDFSHQSPGTAALALANTYNKISVFGDFSCVNGNPPPAADEVFYFGAATFIGASAPSAPPLGGTPTLSSIAITPTPLNLAPAATQQLTVTGTYSNNSTQNTTAGSSFASNATGVATVSSGGLVTAVSVGSATITATDTASGKTATVTVTVATGGGGGNGVVFASGALDAGVGFVPFGGSTNVPLPAVDATTLYTDGTAALKVVVTGAAGAYSGGAWVASSPRDLRSFNALTFWAKGSQVQSTLKVQLGNDSGSGANVDFQVESIGIPLTTSWRQYAIPLPDPAKANGIDGLISFADANNNYTFWLANVQYQNLPASVLGTGFVAGDGFNGVQLSGSPASLSIPVGSSYGINPGPNSIVWTLGTAAFNGSTFVPLPNGGNLNNDAWRWFTLASSNNSVATVSADGVINAVASGTANISGTLAGTAIPGIVPVKVTAPLAQPTINAPTPGLAAGNVVALFDSNSLYAHNTIDNLNENWCGAGATEAPYAIPGGNTVLNYVLPNCTGIGFEAHTINLTTAGMTRFHIDIWTPNPVSTILQLVDAAGGGVGSFTPTLVANTWNSIDVPISSFTGLSATTAIQQIGFINGGQFTVLYIDNMYFHN